MRVNRRAAFLTGWLLLTAAAGAGCGGGEVSKSGDGTGPTGKDSMTDLAGLLQEAAELKRKPPARTADLSFYEASHPVATAALMRNDVVYAWGTGLGGGQTVVAYEAKADANGGWVLLQDGTVKQMTADEFKAAPKAGKK